MIEEIFLNLGGIGVALYVMWDNNRRMCQSLDKISDAVASCPRK